MWPYTIGEDECRLWGNAALSSLAVHFLEKDESLTKSTEYRKMINRYQRYNFRLLDICEK